MELCYYRTALETLCIAKYPFGVPEYIKRSEKILAIIPIPQEQESLELGELTRLYPCPKEKANPSRNHPAKGK